MIVLSDHTGDMVAKWEIRHSQLHDIEMARYRRESEDLSMVRPRQSSTKGGRYLTDECEPLRYGA